MNKTLILSSVLGTIMLCSAAIAKLITPNAFLAATRPILSLESGIPTQFGGWKEQKGLNSLIVNPQQDTLIAKLYTQTISRIYVNEKSDRIMLSVAYGADQRDANALHYPEVCYPAQGFKVNHVEKGTISTSKGGIAVNRLETNLANFRYEPVTYWTTVGDVVVNGSIDKKLTEIKFGIKGKIPDGIIFRVSSIDQNASHAFELHASFVDSLIKELHFPYRKWLTGLD